MTLHDACNVLHVNEGDNDELIQTLVSALPDYIEVATGLSVDNQVSEPMVDTVAGLLNGITPTMPTTKVSRERLTRS